MTEHQPREDPTGYHPVEDLGVGPREEIKGEDPSSTDDGGLNQRVDLAEGLQPSGARVGEQPMSEEEVEKMWGAKCVKVLGDYGPKGICATVALEILVEEVGQGAKLCGDYENCFDHFCFCHVCSQRKDVSRGVDQSLGEEQYWEKRCDEAFNKVWGVCGTLATGTLVKRFGAEARLEGYYKGMYDPYCHCPMCAKAKFEKGAQCYCDLCQKQKRPVRGARGKGRRGRL